MGDLTTDFSRHEFECKCGCGTDNISMDLVTRLQRLRTLYRKPIIINSGCRCEKHNKDEGGKSDSAHLASNVEEGEAVDIHVNNGGELYEILEINSLYSIFTRIGIGKSLIHFDIDKNKPQRCIWPYLDK